MDWQDVDLEKSRIFAKTAYVRGQLKGTKTKSGKREVTLQPQAREALLNQKTYTGSGLMKPFFMIPALTKPGKTISLSVKMCGLRH